MRFSTPLAALVLALTADAAAVRKPLIGRQQDSSTETTDWGSECRRFSIPVSVTRTLEGEVATEALAETYNLNTLMGLVDQQILVDGEYEVSARYCEPPSGVKIRDSLLYLAHGATFNSHMFDFGYNSEEYSWTRNFNLAGYRTLAVDFLGAGNSSHPHGLLETQTETLIQTTRQVLEQVRSGELLDEAHDKVAFVGFSLGGMLAIALGERYPETVDQLVILGAGWRTQYSYPIFMGGLQTAGRLADEAKFGEYDDFYQTPSSRAARVATNFVGDYDEAAVDWDWETRDLDTLGVAISFTFALRPVPSFTGPVMVGHGEFDTFCCGERCTNQPYDVYEQIPNAADYTVRIWPNTGHAVHAHHTGPQALADIREFLDSH